MEGHDRRFCGVAASTVFQSRTNSARQGARYFTKCSPNLTRRLCTDYFRDKRYRSSLLDTVYVQIAVLSSLERFHDPYDAPMRRPEASWRRMLCTQPPTDITPVEFSHHHRPQAAIHRRPSLTSSIFRMQDVVNEWEVMLEDGRPCMDRLLDENCQLKNYRQLETIAWAYNPSDSRNIRVKSATAVLDGKPWSKSLNRSSTESTPMIPLFMSLTQSIETFDGLRQCRLQQHPGRVQIVPRS